jgi:hypothetical protein
VTGPPQAVPSANAPEAARQEKVRAPGLAGASWPVLLLVTAGISSVLSGLVRAAMFGSDTDPSKTSPAYLGVTYALSFAVTLVLGRWARGRQREALRRGYTPQPVLGSAFGVAVLAAVLLGIPMQGTDAGGQSFDYSQKFKERVYVVVATRDGSERLLMLTTAPVGDSLDLPDGTGGTVTVEVVSTAGPFKTPADVCSGGQVSINGAKVTAFGWEGLSWDCTLYKEKTKRGLGAVVFGVIGLALIGMGVSAGSVVAVGVGIASGAYAAWIWFHGAPKPINVDRMVQQMVQNSKQVKAAQQAATDLESAMRGHMSEKDLREAADFTEQYLVKLTEQQKADFYRSQGIPVESLLKQVKDLKTLKDW